MNLHSQPTPSLRRVRKRVHERLHKRVHFKPYSDLEDVRMIENRESLQQHHHHRRDSSQQENTLFHHNQIKGDQAINLEGVPSLFRCKSREEIVNVIKTGKGAIADVFRGYNALHWYCNAKSTSLGIIQELLHRGIDINAVDQRTRTRGPIIRHTALGYACRNANIKAVRTLLQNGADPCGLGTSAQLMGLPKQGVHSNQIVADDRPICRDCAADYHIWEPWPETEAEKASARERRRSNFRSQILRLGNRLRACVQLLLDYGSSDPPAAFPQCDDPHLWSGLDCFLETFWRFYYPLAVCERAENPTEKAFPASPGHLPHPISQPVFSAYGEICDMLLESEGYAMKSTAWKTRGHDRLISLIVEHSELSSFEQGFLPINSMFQPGFIDLVK
ncbi:hypothetical protein F5B18DRAFT_676829 [Nemania serpens]|nr:hypothetical protein F5B18DRAFT_676829 [Nemania serpens]